MGLRGRRKDLLLGCTHEAGVVDVCVWADWCVEDEKRTSIGSEYLAHKRKDGRRVTPPPFLVLKVEGLLSDWWVMGDSDVE